MRRGLWFGVVGALAFGLSITLFSYIITGKFSLTGLVGGLVWFATHVVWNKYCASKKC